MPGQVDLQAKPCTAAGVSAVPVDYCLSDHLQDTAAKADCGLLGPVNDAKHLGYSY